jgi:hypothetical protein
VVPVAGPFIAATGFGGRVQLSADPIQSARSVACEDAENFGTAIYTFDGLFQVAGAALLTAGLFSPRQVLVKDTAPSESPKVSPSSVRWQVVPWNVGTSAAGIDLVGAF